MPLLPECPRCEQDYVRNVRLVATGELLQMCEECLATWPLGAQVKKSTFTQLSTITDERGLPLDSPVEVVETPGQN